MYIIVSATSNYRGKHLGVDCVVRAGTIGHEIHITRPILLFLLCNQLVTEDDIIVTKNNERFFLYSAIFKNIIEYDSLPLNINSSEILDITSMNALHEERFHYDFKIELEETFPILKKLRNNLIEIRTEKFNQLLSNMKYIELENHTTEKPFVVLHHRHTFYGEMNLEESVEIIAFFLTHFPDLNIILFTIINPAEFPFQSNDRITFVPRIDVYASYMNHRNCKAVLSTFSGGGQLAQFCHPNTIFYYSNGGYPFYPNQKVEDIFSVSNDNKNMYSFFDLKKTTDCNIMVFEHSKHVLEYILEHPL
jgi:hypothetical protein